MKDLGIFDYMRAAFKTKYNVMGLAWFLIAGVITTPTLFWPIGLAMEVLYLTTISHNKRFQRLVDAQWFSQQRARVEDKKNTILNQLSSDRQKRFSDLHDRCINIHDKPLMYLQDESAKLLDEQQITTVNKLLWLFLKTLYYEQILSDFLASNLERDLQGKIREAEEKIKIETKEASKKNLESLLEILKKRFENFIQAKDKLDAIKGYLLHLENLVLLSREQAITKSDPSYIESQISAAKGGLESVEELVKSMDINVGHVATDEEIPVFVKAE